MSSRIGLEHGTLKCYGIHQVDITLSAKTAEENMQVVEKQYFSGTHLGT